MKPTVFLHGEDNNSTSTLEETTDSEESAETENFPMDLTEIASSLSALVDNENKNSGELSKSQTDFSVTAPVKPAVVFMSDYTTMEFFQQVAMGGIQGPSTQTGKPGLSVQPGQDYVRQSCFAEKGQPSVHLGASNSLTVFNVL